MDEADDEPTGSSAAMPSMSAPSMKEKEEHFVSHFPFRAWCEHCVRGKAKAMKHVRVDHSEEQVPVISVDYCFMNSKDDTVSPKIPNRNIHLFSWFETDGQEWFLHTCYLTKEFRKAQ